MKHHAFYVWLCVALIHLSIGTACSSENGDDTRVLDTDRPADDASTQSVTLTFAAQAGDAPVGCGDEVEGLGATQSSMTIRDFRFYVHDVQLVADDGSAVPLFLEQDGKWQRDGVALLDFEDGASACEFGNSDMRAKVTGELPAGSYTGLRFRVGVPFAQNHANAAEADAPLNLSAMFWNWNAGYKFLRIDMRNEQGDPFNVHLGSTGCQGDQMGNISGCLNENRVSVELDDFAADRDVIVVDLAELLADTDLESNELQPGCMSNPDDSDCEPYFRNLGLLWQDQPASSQRVFRRE